MNGLAIVALVFTGVWLAVLTLVIILVVRQLGLLTVRLSMTSQAFSVADDGLDVGSKVPEEAFSSLPQLEQGLMYLLLLSATCSPCRELVTEFQGRYFGRNVIAIVAGHKELADGLAALLPLGTQIVRDPEASTIAKILDVHSVPFGLEIENGTVTRKAYLHRASDFNMLLEDKHASEMRQVPSDS